MTPRPIHRWKSFWLGVFVACFLGWAWGDSYRCVTMLRVVQIDWGMQVYRAYGKTFHDVYPTWWHERVFAVSRVPTPSPAEFSPFPFCPPPPFESGVLREWKVVPDWLVFFSWLGLWAAWMGWRWRWRWVRGRGRECRVEG